ncbi:cytochrome P450 2U1-like [Clavelina lepadiformis]|uniref:cytochrome P450 2U1-like n=1 Tax=Clavelina lepadiformis TaxID=159417 RepID=UPI0040435E64
MLERNYLNAFILTCTVVLPLIYWYWRPRKYPPGPRGIPVLGMLPFMGKYTERKLAKWSKTYGNVMSLRFGRTDVVFLNDYGSIHEALVNQGRKFAGRPKYTLPFITDLAKGAGLADMDYGKFFMSQKKLGYKALRGLGVGRTMESRVYEEESHLIDAIRSMEGKPFKISKIIQKAISNNILSVVFGQRFDYDDKHIQDIMNRLLNMLEDQATSLSSRICTLAPFLKDIPPIVFVYSRFKKRISVSLDYIRKKIYEHQETFQKNDLRDFIDTFLKQSIIENNQDLTISLYEIASTTLSWALLCLLHHPEKQKKLREEIMKVLCCKERVSVTHKFMMPYTNAFIQEVMRYRTLSPIGVSHKTTEDAELNGYFIPKDTVVATNLWAVHNDPGYWEEPEKFKPERFIDDNGELIQSSHVIPFSLGIRQCLGKQLAQMEIFIFLVSMIQNFEFLPDPHDKELPNIDEGVNGLQFLPYAYRVIAKSL